MKSHPRIRKTMKWGGVALTAMLIGMWIGSLFWTFGWGGRNGVSVFGWRGTLQIGRANVPVEAPIFAYGIHCFGPFSPDPLW